MAINFYALLSLQDFKQQQNSRIKKWILPRTVYVGETVSSVPQIDVSQTEHEKLRNARHPQYIIDVISLSVPVMFPPALSTFTCRTTHLH